MAPKVYFTDFCTGGRETLPQKLARLIMTAGFDQIDFEKKYAAIKMDKTQIEMFVEVLFPIRENMNDRVKETVLRKRQMFLSCYNEEGNKIHQGNAWGQWQPVPLHQQQQQQFQQQQQHGFHEQHNHIGQPLDVIFGNNGHVVDLNQPPLHPMPDLNVLPNQLNEEEFLELNDLLNPVQPNDHPEPDIPMADFDAMINPVIMNGPINEADLQQAEDNQSELTLTISSDDSTASDAAIGVVNQGIIQQNFHIGMVIIQEQVHDLPLANLEGNNQLPVHDTFLFF
jgi:hypothetical protein